MYNDNEDPSREFLDTSVHHTRTHSRMHAHMHAYVHTHTHIYIQGYIQEMDVNLGIS